MNPFKRNRDVDMTEGGITKHIINFALPLLVGNIFQQLYNTVDTWVVGNFVSNEAFSAVGTVGPIINTLIGFFAGLASGAGVVISQYYGAKNYKKVSQTVHTALLLTFAASVICTVLGLILAPEMLTLMKTPAEVFPQSKKYLSIYFSGVTGLMVYNMGAGILRAVGDSQRPFYFLIVSTTVNIALDLFFVIKLHMGVEGVAYATVISQFISAVLTIIVLMTTSSCVRFRLKWLKMQFDILKKILRVGLPAALQLAVTAFSNLFVQSYINYFGSDCMSGWTAYSKIDMLLFLPMQSVSLAATTFVGQNLGKGNEERAKKGIRRALVISMISTAIFLIPVIIFAPQLTAFFNPKPEVIKYGSMLLRYISPFYILCCINQVYASALRGSGNSRTPMIIMLCSFVLFRQVYLFIVSNFISNTIIPIAMGYPAGWFMCSLITLIYYRKADLSKHKLT